MGSPKKILLLCYSFSGQTNGLLRGLAASLENQGHEVLREKLNPSSPLRFPVGSIPATFKIMITTFFRQRVAIEPLSEECRKKFDLIILAGPTWSYNPSGPVLSLIDRDGPALFNQQTILPLISCRGYWRMHLYGLKRMLYKHGAIIPNSIIFSHPSKEPWRTIGVFLKIAGKNPERGPFLRRFYKRFGHSKPQQAEAARFGTIIGQALNKGDSLADLNFRTPTALP